MTKVESEIARMVDKETKAWNDRDAETLISLFHPDMVWPWPKTPQSHDPMDWEMPLGKFNRKRWKTGWQDLFDNFRLVRNIRKIRKIAVSNEKDGAFAVVDIDTLWVDGKGNKNQWKGRVCKVYSKVKGAWKITMHTGVLEY